MTVHKLTAGDGYTYLTRQVASADEPRPAGQSLADYYVARGNPPGVWLGGGAEQLGVAGSEVTEAQMKALFGEGRHPDRDAMLAAGLPRTETRLGLAYPNYADLAPYPDRVAAQVAAFTEAHGREPTPQERNRITSKEARRGRRAVAGFDLVFTPVKSASVLWGLGGPEVRQAVEDAHHEAVRSTIGWVEQHAAFTRIGKRGVAQIDTTGLICAAFDHRESRSGDPDLHTHVAVANKVCGVDGKWRSLDARGLYAIGVAASERYNTRFEDALARRLGVEFGERRGTGRDGKRPVREIVGIPVELIRHFSRRRAAIEDRYAELRSDYRHTHGREPDQTTQFRLAQQATLETREGKPPGRTLAEQTTDWAEQARGVIGRRKLDGLVTACIGRQGRHVILDDRAVDGLARQVVRTVAESKATWTIWNIHAETERHMRSLRFATAGDREQATDHVVQTASSPTCSIRIAAPEPGDPAPHQIRDSDGRSVSTPHGSDRFTTSEILNAEEYLIAAGSTTGGPHVDAVVLDASLAVHESKTGVALDPGQKALVQHFAASPARLALGIGPAGAGKTTAMRAFTNAWQSVHADTSGRVVPLATSAKAAQVLGSELDTRAENLHKFLHEHQRPGGPTDDWFALRAGDIVLVDEAGMAGTLHLAELTRLATEAGAAVRLLGDPAQLTSVDAGGALSLLEHEVGAAYLTDLHRFTNPAEAHATLKLRRGDPEAIAFYESNDRIHSGSRDAMLEHAYDAWATDVHNGRTSVLIAAANEDVTALNARARLERVLAGQVSPDGITLHDGTTVGTGDWIVTRTNKRTLAYRRGRWVHNGDTWQVTRQHEDGSLTVKHLDNHGTVRLPAGYVDESVELSYASTAHRVQGTTTDTAHALITPDMTREALYVASTRGQNHTGWYVATGAILPTECQEEMDAPRTMGEVVMTVLARTGEQVSATESLRRTRAQAAVPASTTMPGETPSQATFDHVDPRHAATLVSCPRPPSSALE